MVRGDRSLGWSVGTGRWDGPSGQVTGMVRGDRSLGWSVGTGHWDGPWGQVAGMVRRDMSLGWSTGHWNGPWGQVTGMVRRDMSLGWSVGTGRWDGPSGQVTMERRYRSLRRSDGPEDASSDDGADSTHTHTRYQRLLRPLGRAAAGSMPASFIRDHGGYLPALSNLECREVNQPRSQRLDSL